MNTKQIQSFQAAGVLILARDSGIGQKIKYPWIAGKNPDRICRKYFTERETAR